MKRLVVAVLLLVLLSGCNTGVAFSILGDLVKLRIDRDAAGKGHIEDAISDKESENSR